MELLLEEPDSRSSLLRRLAISSREYEIMILMAEGLADKESAERLGISQFTVNRHVRSLLLKLDATSRTQAAVKALKLGLID